MNHWYEVTQTNADTGETYTGTGHTAFEALAQVVSNGQAATRYRAEDAAWLNVVAESLTVTGAAEIGFARYSMTTEGPVRFAETDHGGGMCDECGKPAPTIWYAWLGGPDQDHTALCADCAAIHLPGVALPVMVGTLSEGETGTVAADGGRFAGRRFRVRHIGSTGRTVWLDWTEHGTNGYVRATTLVTRLVTR